jgi:pyruvate ferredoxin oxidoreductase gamma subunit
VFRVRFHGRGGQGIKTASRVLGRAFFLEGFEVQDAPRYGAERRGAPIFAYVRAARRPINERGVIRQPDLVIVGDETLVTLAASGVLAGVGERTTLLLNTRRSAAEWRERLCTDSNLVVLPKPVNVENPVELPFVGATCTGAAACLTGVISRDTLAVAIEEELGSRSPAVIIKNQERALQYYDLMEPWTGVVIEGGGYSASGYAAPGWIDLPFDGARVSAPAIHAGDTSKAVATGLWRIMRPILDPELCNRCTWICTTFCPEGAMSVDVSGYPDIDYEHCKGCMICASQCRRHAIHALPEHQAAAEAAAGRHLPPGSARPGFGVSSAPGPANPSAANPVAASPVTADPVAAGGGRTEEGGRS